MRVNGNQSQSPPVNVLWILCDELRADALSCYGNTEPEIETPHIDALAAQGVLFEESYTTSPVCVPARTAMLTGRKPAATGIYGNEAYSPGYPEWNPPGTFTEAFAKAGWTTINYGKEHVPSALSPWQSHDPDGSSMADIRADVQRAGVDAVRTGLGNIVGARLPEDECFSSSALTENACRALEELEEPFVLRASFLQPHTPVVVPEPWASTYDHVPFGDNGDPGPGDFERQFAEFSEGKRMTEQERLEARRLYHASVRWVDEQVGSLMSSLKTRGLEGNTVVVFTSDHGANLGEDGSFGKHTFAARSHRVPCIISSPGRIPAGQRRGDLVTSEDLAPTLLSLGEIPSPYPMDGRDLFADPAPSHITSVIGYGAPQSRAFPNKDFGGWQGHGWPQRLCIRTQRYRLDLNTRVDGRPPLPHERDLVLIDRVNDPAEKNNLADHPRYEHVQNRLLDLALKETRELSVPDDEAIYGNFVPPAPASGP